MTDAAYPEHPRVAVGAAVFKGDSVLLVLRGKPPNEGLWAVPGGSVELGETLQAAAEREVMEETGISMRAGEPVYVFDAVHRDAQGRVSYHYVIADVVGEYLSGEPVPDDDALEARWVSPAELDSLRVSDTTVDLLKNTLGFGTRSTG